MKKAIAMTFLILSLGAGLSVTHALAALDYQTAQEDAELGCSQQAVREEADMAKHHLHPGSSIFYAEAANLYILTTDLTWIRRGGYLEHTQKHFVIDCLKDGCRR